ncbi:MAG: metallophosphoesterase [Saprospiraceae bacterium]|nr:metallophosphoesterase [Saprospiraceae bacterium]
MNFSFVQITDHHILESETELFRGLSTAYTLRVVLSHISANLAGKIDFIVSTGDLVNSPSVKAYQTLSRVLNVQTSLAAAPGPLPILLEGSHEIPLYCLPGNHDDHTFFYRHLFSQAAALPLMNAVFTHGGVQFICLDWGPDTKAILHSETLDFLEQSLQTDQPSILMMHHHLAPCGAGWLDEFIADGSDLFWKTITDRNVLGVFCGHAHMTYDKIVAGIPVFGLRSTAFQFALQDEPLICLLPAHYRLITLQNGILTSRIYEVPL